MAYEIEVIELTPQPALVVETECAPGEFGDVLAASFGRVFQHMGARSAQPHGMPFMRYLDMGDENAIICPYCSTLYVYQPTLGKGASDPADAVYAD